MDSMRKAKGAALTSDESEMAEVTAAVPGAERGRRGKGPEERPRLVVELSPATAAMLNELCDLEHLNKTTVVNRALQVYHVLRTAEAAGGQVLMSDSEGGELQRVRFI